MGRMLVASDTSKEPKDNAAFRLRDGAYYSPFLREEKASVTVP